MLAQYKQTSEKEFANFRILLDRFDSAKKDLTKLRMEMAFRRREAALDLLTRFEEEAGNESVS